MLKQIVSLVTCEAVFSIFEWPTILGFIDFDIYL